MKKILITTICFWALLSKSQTSFNLTNMSNSLTIAEGSTINLLCPVNDNVKLNIDITNTSTSSVEYKVQRTNFILNSGAFAHFCFAIGCYDESQPISTNNLTLTPGQSASKSGAPYALLTELDEGPVLGLSRIVYRVSNANSSKDAIEFTIEYNKGQITGVNKFQTGINTLNLFPNPASGKVQLQYYSESASRINFILFNSIGQIISEHQTGVVQGLNSVDLPLNNVSTGIYTVKLSDGNTVLTKKLMVN